MESEYAIFHHTKLDTDGTELAEGVNYFAVHEIFRNDEGSIYARTQNREGLSADTKEELIALLEQILKDCKDAEVLVEPYDYAPKSYVDDDESDEE